MAYVPLQLNLLLSPIRVSMLLDGQPLPLSKCTYFMDHHLTEGIGKLKNVLVAPEARAESPFFNTHESILLYLLGH